jgi:hypothetical protein
MTDTATVNGEALDEDHENDLVAMVEEIGTAVATGLVPFLAQAINIYDTIESMLTLHRSQGAEAENEAKFDLVLALVGWIPGAGGGVKKTIRIVNKNPQRYAPILFDVLRMVCAKLGIQTSPESLLDKLFDAAGLKAILGTVQSSVEKSWAYEQMPSEGQMALSSTMTMVRASLPAMLTLVLMKLVHWKKMQRNTAARSTGSHKRNPAAPKPAPAHPDTGKGGTDDPHRVTHNTSANAVVGTAPLEEITKGATGMLGEHITDYFLYEEYGWGRGWSAHDQGNSGSWATKPGKEFPGKLNEGSKLNPLLALKAHGVGIDGVWKVQIADPKNAGKPYAIVESKASANETEPKNPSRKPPIKGKLLDNTRKFKKPVSLAAAAAKAASAAMPPVADLLEPRTTAPAGPERAGGKRGGQSARTKKAQQKKTAAKTSSPTTANGAVAPQREAETKIVQMSQVWIEKNIGLAVKVPAILYEINRKGIHVYSRHLFYTPFYLPSALEHALALRSALPGKDANLGASHTSHSIPSTHRHDEIEVKRAVNSKHEKLGLPQEP